MDLQECCNLYLSYIESVRCLSPNTVLGYKEDFKHLNCILGCRDIQSISYNDLRNTIGELSKQKYNPASINRYISAVRGLFAYCKKIKAVDHNVALELKNLKTPKYLPQYMTQAEIDILCKEPEKEGATWPLRDKALFEMLYSSGCRVSEIASLSFNDFKNDFSSAVITGKGNKQREVYFEKDAVKALKEYLEERKKIFPEAEKNGSSPVKFIFLNKKGEALSVGGIQYIVRKYSSSGDFNKHITPHSFRHTFATSMLNNGADVRMIQKMLGHSSINTTQKYTHLNKQELKNIYDQAFPHSGKKD